MQGAPQRVRKLSTSTVPLILQLAFGFVDCRVVTSHHHGQTAFFSPQVKAELQKQWSRFLLADPFGCKLCFLGENIKYLRKCSQKQKKQHLGNKHHLRLEAREPWGIQLQQVLVKQRTNLSTEPGCALPSCPRASMSDSSEGEVTTGETTEEVFEESEI